MTTQVAQLAPAAQATARFIKLDANGQQLPADATDHVAVLDTSKNLMWTADTVATGKTWKQAKKSASAVRIGGHKDWRLPELDELESIRDLTRYSPAIDTEFFRCESSYYWSNTPLASSPSDCAWSVNFGDGDASYYGQGGNARVRACRSVSPAGQ